MSNTLSVYWSPHHMRVREDDPHSDFNYIRNLNPAWIRIHQPTAVAIYHAQRAAPNAKIMLRSWDIDDHNGDRKREMYESPANAARKHLRMWRGKLDNLKAELQRNGWTHDESKWYLGLVNEPDPAYVPQAVEYSLVAMDLARGRYRLGVVCSSVGTFSKPSENDHGWTQFIPLEQPINAGGHILIAHEYWQPEGPSFGEDAGNLAWRHRIIPLNVPILIGESGANGFIYGRHSANDDSGWQKTVKDPAKYAAQVKEYIEGCDQRVRGVCLYMTDFHSDQWWSFDTLPAHEQLLAVKDTKPQVASPFAPSAKHDPTYLPSVPGTGKPQPTAPQVAPTAVVAVVAGANIRTGPGTSFDILGAVPSATPLSVVGKNQGGDWWQVLSEWGTGWVSAPIVRTHNVEGVPVTAVNVVQPQPSGSDFGRVMPFILRWEGTWADNPADPGGATMKGITIGTYTRWREAHGQPKPTVNDLRNISDVEVLQIYKEWYWKESGADKLPWPLCLAHMDTAVNAGVGRAQEMLQKSDGDFLAYMGHLIDWYTRIPNFEHFGRAWIRRRAEILLEAAK